MKLAPAVTMWNSPRLHGEEGMLVTLVGPMLALVSVVADSGDTIKSIKCQDTNIVFLVKPPLILVGVSSAGLHTSQLTVQLLYVHSQIVSVLTMTQLARIFEQKPNYDLRRMLTGSERLISSLSNSMDTDPSYFLSAVRCLPLATPTRDLISETIISETWSSDQHFNSPGKHSVYSCQYRIAGDETFSVQIPKFGSIYITNLCTMLQFTRKQEAVK